MRTKPTHRKSPVVMEQVEPRRLMAANLYNVFGTEGDDEISVRYVKTTSGDVLFTRVNGQSNAYYTPDVAQIKIAGKGGNDKITYSDSEDDLKDFGVLIYGDAGNDTIQLGSEGTFRIKFLDYKSIQIDGGTGSDRLIMDGSRNTSYGETFLMTYDYIAFTNTAVRQSYFGLENIDIKHYQGTSLFMVKGLKPGTNLNITGSSANSTLRIGEGNLYLTQGRVNFDGVSGNDRVVIDDSLNLLPRNYTQYETHGQFSNSNGSWSGKNVDSLDMKGSQASNSFRFRGLQAGLPTVISPGLGFDTLEIGNGDLVGNIKSPVYFWDDTGNTGKIIVDDRNDTGDDSYNVSGGQVTKTGSQPLQFAYANRVELQANKGANAINVTPSSGPEFFIDGNEHSPAGDTLNLTLAPGEVAIREGVGSAGAFKFASKKPITFQEIENSTGSLNLPTLSIDDQAVFEGNSGSKVLTFTVKLSAASYVPVSVNVLASSNTATSGSDFTALPASLTFVPGQTTETFTVTVLGDVDTENDESFFVTLSDAVNATLLKGLGFGAIINDDLISTDGPS